MVRWINNTINMLYIIKFIKLLQQIVFYSTEFIIKLKIQ